jgi:hypothetical protein
MKTRNILVSAVLLLLLVSGIFMYQYNKPARNIHGEEAIRITAEQLFQQFSTNEQVANTLYLNKVVEVNGDVVEIKHTEQGKDVVVLKSTDPMFGTSCTLAQKSGEMAMLKPGDKATLKGICTGYLTDVVLIRGELIK